MTFTCIAIAIAVFVVSYVVCELLEVKDDGGTTDFTLIAKSI